MNQEKRIDRTKAVFVQIVERPDRKVLIKRGVDASEYFQYCEEVGCDVWPLLTSVKEALYGLTRRFTVIGGIKKLHQDLRWHPWDIEVILKHFRLLQSIKGNQSLKKYEF